MNTDTISRGKYFVTEINSSVAFQFTSQYHDSGTGSKKARINLGIFRQDTEQLVGVMQWGRWGIYGVKDGLKQFVNEPISKDEHLLLLRFSMLDEEEHNSESSAIALGIKWIKRNRPNVKLLISYSGGLEKDYGYVYQASNFEYLGFQESNLFWLVDRKRKHQVTLQSQMTSAGAKGSFKDFLMNTYDEVIRYTSKQFIYVYRLDKKLTLATDTKPYPKEMYDAPVCTNFKIYKGIFRPEDMYFTKEEKPFKWYWSEVKNLELFTNRALIRQGKKHKQVIVVYDKFGKFEGAFKTITDVANHYNISQVSISTGLKTGKLHNGHFFIFKDEEAVALGTLDSSKYICEIDGHNFARSIDIANYCGVSRQAASQSVKRKAKKIGNYDVIWK